MLPLALANEKTAPAMGVSVGSVVDDLMNVTGTATNVCSLASRGDDVALAPDGSRVRLSAQA
jgi:hypothetical protein